MNPGPDTDTSEQQTAETPRCDKQYEAFVLALKWILQHLHAPLEGQWSQAVIKRGAEMLRGP